MSRPSDTHSIEQTHPASDCDIAYVGYRQSGQAIVEKGSGQERLTPERSLELVNHSPSGFEWGYGGSGPAQLALALLLDYTDDEAVALDHYQEFKTEVVTNWTAQGLLDAGDSPEPRSTQSFAKTPGEPAAPSI